MSRLLFLSFFMISMVALSLELSGCSRMLNGLRRDLDDSEPTTSPTVGGKWTEKGFLADDMNDRESDYYGTSDRYSAVGHSERAPASQKYEPAANSWINANQDSNARRDYYRSTPDSGNKMLGESTPQADVAKRQFKKGVRATRSDFVDESSNDGSLWASGGQTNYFFTKNKVRGVGDIITVNIEQELLRDTGAEVMRTLSVREKDTEVADVQERLRKKALGIEDVDPNKKDAKRAPATVKSDKSSVKPEEDEIAVPRATMADVDIFRNLSVKAGDTIMGEIVERYPNGNYKIKGTKKIPYRQGYRTVALTGVVRGADISEEDLVNSGKMYEYRLEVAR